MTTKPTHTTVRRRHGVDGRRSNDLAKRAQLERDLADALAQLDKPKRSVRVAEPRLFTVVILTVREKSGGLPKRWEYWAPSGAWTCEAEHLARMAAREAGFIVHAHIDTVREERA